MPEVFKEVKRGGGWGWGRNNNELKSKKPLPVCRAVCFECGVAGGQQHLSLVLPVRLPLQSSHSTGAAQGTRQEAMAWRLLLLLLLLLLTGSWNPECADPGRLVTRRRSHVYTQIITFPSEFLSLITVHSIPCCWVLGEVFPWLQLKNNFLNYI